MHTYKDQKKLPQAKKKPNKVLQNTMNSQANINAIIQRAQVDPGSLTRNDITVLQRTVGNKAINILVQRQSQSLDKISLPNNLESKIIQTKALAKDKLNVAGETHGESKPLRGKEKQYTKEMTGGVYKTEGEFKTTKWLTERYGDPMLLRAEMLLAILKEKSLPLFLVPFSQGSIPDRLQSPDDIETTWDNYREYLIKDIKEIMLALRIASNEEAEQDQAQKAFDAYENLEKLSKELPKTRVDGVGNIILEINKTISLYARNVLDMDDIRAEKVVSALRSSAMQEAAADDSARWFGQAQKGVWKVGNSHIPEIKAEKEGDDYEILTKDEFNEDFHPWLEENP